MIVSKKKPYDEVLELVKDSKTVVLTGCSECATACQTGGEPELAALKDLLEAEGKTVLATKVLTTSCNVLLNKKELKEIKDEINSADAVICMACGDGVGTVGGMLSNPVYPSNDTLFVGDTVRNGVFQEMCKTCGECILGTTAAICPITRCGKSLVNGACGGSRDGKCEVIPENECAWIEIYKKLKDQGKEASMEEVPEIRGFKNKAYPRTINLREMAKMEEEAAKEGAK